MWYLWKCLIAKEERGIRDGWEGALRSPYYCDHQEIWALLRVSELENREEEEEENDDDNEEEERRGNNSKDDATSIKQFWKKKKKYKAIRLWKKCHGVSSFFLTKTP